MEGIYSYKVWAFGLQRDKPLHRLVFRLVLTDSQAKFFRQEVQDYITCLKAHQSDHHELDTNRQFTEAQHICDDSHSCWRGVCRTAP